MSQQQNRLYDLRTTVNGLRIFARVAQHPADAVIPPIVFVHALATSSSYMLPTAGRLARYGAVYAPDLPGYGRSAKPKGFLDFSALADVLAAWMQAVGVAPAVLIGHSTGCHIVTQFAIRHPAQIAHAVLLSPTMDPTDNTLPQDAYSLFRVMLRESPALYVVLMREYLETGFLRLVKSIDADVTSHIEADLPQVAVPTLVVRGARDTLVSAKWAREAVNLLPRGQLIVVPGGSHAMQYTEPRQLMRLLLPLLKEWQGTP